MSEFNFTKAYDYFNEPMARNILFVGENFDFEKDSSVLDLKWNTVFTFLQEKEAVYKLQNLLQTDTRQVTLRDNNLEDAQKLAHQHDYRNLNLISLWDDSKTLRANKHIAEELINRFCAQSLLRFGYAYFVGYTEDGWFDAEERLMGAMTALFEREHCIVIDNCADTAFADFKEAIDAEKGNCNCFLLLKESLAAAWKPLQTDNDEDWDDEFAVETPDVNELLFFVNKKNMSMPKAKARSISSFARLLDYEELSPTPKPKYLHPSYFAAFLKNNTGYPKWFGYAEKYALERGFQKDLTEAVHNSLENPANFDHRPILLHGQSGAGKSVALGQLAYDIFHEKKFPVIYITNPTVTFSVDNKDNSEAAARYRDLFDFIKTLQDDYGAKSTLLIWDCSGFEYERTGYRKLYTYLRNGGLNVALVGTNYQLQNRQAQLKDFYDIPAEIKLNQEELAQFRAILKHKSGLEMDEVDAILRYSNEENFLAILYNIFWDIRNDMSRGIYTEFRQTVKDILNAAPQTKAQDGLFGNIFVRNYEKFNAFISTIDQDRDNQSKLQDFSIYAAILTYFNMSISLDMIYDLLLVDTDTLIKVLNAPIFTTTEQFGNWHYRIRSRLEAEMLLRAYNMSPKSRNKEPFAIYICKLLYGIETAQFTSNSMEEAIEKVTRIISAIGPNSRENETLRWNSEDFYKYAPCLINALTEAGKACRDPRIMIQELTLTRELHAMLATDSVDLCSYETFYSVLKEARTVTDDGFFDLYNQESYIPSLDEKIEKAQSFLREEESCESSLRGYFAQIRIDIANGLIKRANGDLEMLRTAAKYCENVLKNATTDNYAITTWLWSNIHLIKSTHSESERQALAAEAINRADFSMQQSPERANDNYFVQACKELFSTSGEVIDLEKLAEKLRVDPTPAMLYYCAYQECIQKGIIRIEPQFEWRSTQDTAMVKEIYDRYFGADYFTVYAGDVKCLNLQMRLYWLMHNKMPLQLSGERQRTAFTLEQWQELNDLCELAKNLDATQNTFYLRFVRALAQAQLGALSASSGAHFEECNNELTAIRNESRDGNFNQRPIPKYLLCNPDGTPILLKGTIKTISETNGRGKMDVFVNGRVLPNVHFNSNALSVNARPTAGDLEEEICIGVGYMGISATREKVGH